MWHEPGSRRNPARVCCMCQNREERLRRATQRRQSQCGQESQPEHPTHPALHDFPQHKQLLAGTHLEVCQDKERGSRRTAAASPQWMVKMSLKGAWELPGRALWLGKATSCGRCLPGRKAAKAALSTCGSEQQRRQLLSSSKNPASAFLTYCLPEVGTKGETKKLQARRLESKGKSCACSREQALRAMNCRRG